jgi:primosomal protein N' (replication factor Y) (superfamily II helicase)
MDKGSNMNRVDGEFARIAIPSPLKDPLIYRVPQSLRDQLTVGMRVWIPLGKRQVTGVLVEFLSETSLSNVKEILAPQDEIPLLDGSLLRLGQWVAQYYLAPLGEVLATMLPPSLRTESRRLVIIRPGSFAVSGAFEQEILGELQKKKGKTSLTTLTRRFSGRRLYSALGRLETLGAVEILEQPPVHRRKIIEPIFKDRYSNHSQIAANLTLTTEQKRALQVIENRVDQGGYESFLLHGVTGSGKTEVYLRAMERVRGTGRRSLILIPEISLTPQLMDRLNQRFSGRIGILHSALTPSERRSQWLQIVRGEVDVVVGARSAVFAPIPDLGVIVVDEEHDPSYKQEEGLRYNGRDVAVVRGSLTGCPVILGSATPAIESYANCLQGRYRLLEMTQRVEQRALPHIEAVDLRTELTGFHAQTATRKGAPPQPIKAAQDRGCRLLSPRLAEALKNNHRNSKQSLIFLNRRGFANFLQCRLCGFVLRCSYCSVTLTFHYKQKSLFCHHCNFRKPATELCPECGNSTLAGIGAGTEQIEQELQRLVPDARIARMDRDTTQKRGSHEGLIRRWEKGEIDILVGTQMITKGHDVTGVTLVGALLADQSLSLPDFRAAERTFQLLSQVAGRSGRGNHPGRVMIQTYSADHYAFKYLIHHDYKGFFAEEMEFRRALNYPPFSRLVNLRLEGPKLHDVEAKANALAIALRERLIKDKNLSEHIEILGPAPAPIPKLRNRYRWQILLKGGKGSPLLELARQARDIFPRSHTMRLHVDVDPHNML